MNRTGQGISINVVVIAAIALLILVILSVLVIRTGGKVNQGTSCEALGGTCVLEGTYGNSDCNPDTSDFRDRGGFCPQQGGIDAVCCRRL
jgi:hypothetical protein